PFADSVSFPRHPQISTLFPYTTLFRSHAMLFCHWPAELVRRSGNFSCCTNISGEDGQNGCDVTECNIPAPCKAGSNKNGRVGNRSEEHTSELQSLAYLVCRLLLEKKKV